MILGLQQGLKEDGIEVSLVKLCQWFGVARRTVYYRATKAQPRLQEQFVRHRWHRSGIHARRPRLRR